MKRICLFAWLLLVACSSNTAPKNDNPTNGSQTGALDSNQTDTAYMRTGFYFLAESGEGVRMRVHKSDEIYTISPLPFASVDNIRETKLEIAPLEKGDYAELCMTFDNKGSKDLEEGTGNPLHPKIAVIIANKLLYVVSNSTSIKTGIMCVGLTGFSEQEMKAVRIAVDNKK